jgi:UDPglucose 6-dehydrogenase
MERLKVGIVGGCGHIGLVHAVCLASLGYATVAYDIRSEAIKNLQQGAIPFHEPGLKELIQSSMKSGLLTFSDCIDRLCNCDVIYICVGTPSQDSGRADTTQVENAVLSLGRVISAPAVAAIKSTVPVGTARKLSQLLAESGYAEKLTVVSNPEFLSEGSGLKDFMNPARVIVGGEKMTAVKKIASIYSPPGVPVLTTTWENAELIKYASNAFLATKLSFINILAAFSEYKGSDIRIVAEGMGLDPRIGPLYLEAGVGFSGPCLEKDLCSLIHQFNQADEDASLLEAVLHVNWQQRFRLVHKLVEKLGHLDGKEIAVLGLAFKPGTDDVRDSHSLPIIKYLFSLGAAVTVHDPLVGISRKKDRLNKELPGLVWAPSPYEAAKGKDGLLLLTAWPEYRELDLEKLKSCMAVPVFIDGRNLFEPETMRAIKFNYSGLGI